MSEQIVVALDGSECAANALDVAIAISQTRKSDLSICSVADPRDLAGSEAILADRAGKEIRDEAARIIDAALEKARAAGVAAQGRVLEGDPSREIVKFAEASHASEIVVGTHGRSGIARLLMGSVAEGVLRHAAIPVLTVRESVRVGAPTRIMVPIDGSKASLAAIDVAVDLAARLGAQLVVCHVVNMGEVAALTGGEAQLLPQCLEEAEAQGRQIVDEALARVGGRVPVSARIARGEPPYELDALAKDVHPDLIVIGSHGRTGLNRALLGSVAEGLVRGAKSPVMVVPARMHAAVA
jgi:nucleotide-binding universal stress UspA family protein